MRILRAAAGAIFLAVVLPPPVFSDTAKDEVVRELLGHSNYEELSRAYMSEYAKDMVSSWKRTLQPMDAETERELTNELTARLTAEYAVILREIAKLYGDIFTLEELQAMAEFYRTPIGSRVLSKMPELDRRAAQLTYPGLSQKAEEQWHRSVEQLRSRGRKL